MALSPFARLMLKYGAAVAAELLTYYSEAQQKTAPANFQLRKLHVVWERVSGPTGSEIPEDVAVTTQHFVNFTDDAPDPTWTDADFLVVENAWDTAWASIKGTFWSGIKLKELRWYTQIMGQSTTGPAVRVVPKGVAATGTASLPPQVAVSVTEKTALRKRWGRMYLPAPSQLSCATEGYIKAAQHLTIADAMGTLYGACYAGDIAPVVYSPTTSRAFAVEKVQVDDLFDVIRSRRYDKPKVRHLRPV